MPDITFRVDAKTTVDVRVDKSLLEAIVEDIRDWIRDPDTNISEVSRVSGITRMTLHRIRSTQDDLLISTLLILADAYYECEDGKNS